MPVVINELIITTTVDANTRSAGSTSAQSDAPPSDLKLKKAIAEMMRQIKKEMRER